MKSSNWKAEGNYLSKIPYLALEVEKCNTGWAKKMTLRHILVHHVFDLTTYLVIFWAMSDDMIVSPDEKQWSVSQRFWCVKLLFEVGSYVKI